MTVQENVVTRTKGVKTDSWRDLETVYAQIEPLSGVEVTSAEQKEGIVQHRVRMRYRPNVGDVFQFLDGEPFEFLDGVFFEFVAASSTFRARYRLKFGARLFDIRDVQQLYPHDEFTVLRVEERVS